MNHKGTVPTSVTEHNKLSAWGSWGKAQKIDDLENIALTHSQDINQLKIQMHEIGRGLGNLTLEHRHLVDQADNDLERTAKWKREIQAEQHAQATVIDKIPRTIKAAEEKAKNMIEALQANQKRMNEQLKVALKADLHQGERIRELRDELRALRGGQAEHRLVPYKNRQEVVLYKPPTDSDDE